MSELLFEFSEIYSSSSLLGFSFLRILFLVVVIYLSYWYLNRTKSSHPLLKRALGYPIIENLLDFTPNTFIQTAINYPKLYGPITEYYIFNGRGLMVADVEIAKEIAMKRPKKFSRTRNLFHCSEVLQLENGLFHCYGNTWNHIRKATAPSFNQQNVFTKLGKISMEIFHWMERLGKRSSSSSSPSSSLSSSPSSASSAVIDMKYESFSLTIRIITIVAFALEIENPLCQYFFSSQFLQDMEAIFRFSLDSALFFFPQIFWKYIGNYSAELAAREADHRFTTACRAIIEYKRELIGKGNYSITSLIDSMLNKELNGSDHALTDAEIIANVKTIYLAGSDTTAVVLSWIAYYFALYPEYCQRAREEAKQVLFGADMTSREQMIANITQKKVNELKFCNACLKEVLRLTGPASTSGNQTYGGEAVRLSNGIVLGPNDVAWMDIDGIHRDESVFTNALEWIPDRWLTDDIKQLSKMELSYVPFGYGPRICPGMTLAMYEAAIAIAFLAYHYDIRLACPKEEILRIRSLTACAYKVPVELTLVNQILS